MNKIISGILFFLSVSLLLPSISLGQQIAPLASGDGVTIQTLVANQVGTQPITFSPKGSYTYKLVIEENGDRKFLRPNGFITSANDRFFTFIMWQNKLVEIDRRFVRFPQDKKLQAGMKWDVPAWKQDTDCQAAPTMMVNYTATSEDGPEVNLAIDGTDRKIKTIRINYEATLPACWGGRSWRITDKVLYSPELNEVVSSERIKWGADNPRLFLSSGTGWVVIAIQKAGK